MDNALSITGFYFTLIGFISGLFFTRIDAWYGQVREFWGSAKILERSKDKATKYPDMAIKMKGLQESAPKGSFIAVGLFTSALALLSLAIPFVNSPVVNPFLFLRAPLLVTVFIYWVGGFFLLGKGASLLKEVEQQIYKVLPKPSAS